MSDDNRLMRRPRVGMLGKPTSPDADRLLVLTLAAVLAQNHADRALILALLYIAM